MPAPRRSPAAASTGRNAHQPPPRRDAALRRERRRIAQALHDTVCQELTGIGLLVNAAAYRYRALSPEAEQKLREIAELIQRASTTLSQFTQALRGPPPGGR
ncbi:MAG: hypothetical protein JO117_10220 [Verrucomicrobia bacterium]|nr:hypothetical protein [Verrucomicrobiota bacterium]